MDKKNLLNKDLAIRTFELIFAVYVGAWFVHYYDKFIGTFSLIIPVVFIFVWIASYFFLLFINKIFEKLNEENN